MFINTLVSVNKNTIQATLWRKQTFHEMLLKLFAYIWTELQENKNYWYQGVEVSSTYVNMKRIREKPVLLTGSPRLRATKLCLLTWAFIFDKVVFALRKAWIACFCFCWIPPRLPRKLTLPPRTRPPRLPRNGRLPSEKREEGVPRPNPLVFWGNVFLKFVF